MVFLGYDYVVFFSRMLQMLSGPTLYRLPITVAGSTIGVPHLEKVGVDAHVRLAGGQSYAPYVTQPFIEQFGTFLDSLGSGVYQEFAEALLKVGSFFFLSGDPPLFHDHYLY